MRLATFVTSDGTVLAGEVRFALGEITLLAPYVPRLVAGVGLNYALHAAEGGHEPPAVPLIFLKGPDSVTAPGGPVIRPAGVRQLDYEGELAFIAGPGRSVSGYAIANDVSARDFREATLVRQKAGDTFCPWGPWVTTADEIADPYALMLRTWVNGELRQEASTGDVVRIEIDGLGAIEHRIVDQAGA